MNPGVGECLPYKQEHTFNTSKTKYFVNEDEF